MANTPVVSAGLLARLEAFDLDGEPRPTLTFAARLARENGWTLRYADRVVREYKRFVFLMAAAGHPVTPSEQVDQAWHLHLTYTHSYWTRLCGEVVGRPLHHNPTRGGGKEDAKFDAWYERTKRAYERLVGEEPPRDIWPDAADRFGDDLAWVRVNTRHNWVVPKRRVWSGAGVGVGLTAAAGAVGCVSFGPPSGPGQALMWVLIIGLIALFAGVIIARAAASSARSAGRPRGRAGSYDGSGTALLFLGGSSGASPHRGVDPDEGQGDGSGSDGFDGGHTGDSGGGSDGGGGGGGCGGGGCGGGGCGGGD